MWIVTGTPASATASHTGSNRGSSGITERAGLVAQMQPQVLPHLEPARAATQSSARACAPSSSHASSSNHRRSHWANVAKRPGCARSYRPRFASSSSPHMPSRLTICVHPHLIHRGDERVHVGDRPRAREPAAEVVVRVDHRRRGTRRQLGQPPPHHRPRPERPQRKTVQVGHQTACTSTPASRSARSVRTFAPRSVISSCTRPISADPGERDAADLRLVRHDDDPLGALDQREVGVGLHLVVRGAAGDRVDAVDADHDEVEVQRRRGTPPPAGRRARRTPDGRYRR